MAGAMGSAAVLPQGVLGARAYASPVHGTGSSDHAPARITTLGGESDVDTVDSDEIGLGLGLEPGGVTSSEVRRIVADVEHAADDDGLTVAEFIPRQVLHLKQILTGFPLLEAR